MAEEAGFGQPEGLSDSVMSIYTRMAELSAWRRKFYGQIWSLPDSLSLAPFIPRKQLKRRLDYEAYNELSARTAKKVFKHLKWRSNCKSVRLMSTRKAKSSSSKRLKKRGGSEKSEDEEDRISRLPDQTLGCILSRLNVEEAVRTSVLSRRWMKLWKMMTRLDFDSSKRIRQLEEWAFVDDIKEFLVAARTRYVRWVNEVVLSMVDDGRLSRLDEFRVKFPLDAKDSKAIDKWIEIAVLKGVKKLEIDLTSYYGKKRYKISEECCRLLQSPSILPGVECLSSIFFADVNVNGELVEYFLSNCPRLERLAVHFSRSLVKLKVAGPLKYLELESCDSLESLEVSAKLVRLSYYGKRETDIKVVGYNPMLTELCIGGSFEPEVVSLVRIFSDQQLLQIKTLEFRLGLLEPRRGIPQIPELANVKHLVLEVTNASHNFTGVANLIFATPSVEKLTLKVCAPPNPTSHVSISLLKPCLARRLECLKEVEVFGFFGGPFEIGLVCCLFQYVTSLERVLISFYRPPVKARGHCVEEIKISKERAVELKERSPSGVDFLIRS